MSEAEPSVEDFLDEAAAQRARDAGIEPPAKAEDKGKSAKPESGEDASEAGNESKDEGEELEASEAEGDQDDTSDEEEDGDKPKAKPQSRAQKRIRQLTRERDKTREVLAQRDAELAALARMAQQQGQQAKPEAQQQAAADNEPPKQEDFDDYTKYNAALAAWSAAQAVDQRLAEFQKASQQNAQKAAAEAKVADDGSRVRDYFAKGAEKYEDFAEVQNDYFEATDVMVRAVLESETPEDIHYHFAKNPEEAERIAQLSPVAQIREITKLEAKVAKAAPNGEAGEQKPKPVAKKQTSASEPMKPVKAGGAPNKFDPDGCSMDEYMNQYHQDRKEGRL